MNKQYTCRTEKQVMHIVPMIDYGYVRATTMYEITIQPVLDTQGFSL